MSRYVAHQRRHSLVTKIAIPRSRGLGPLLPVSDRSGANEREAERIASNADRSREAAGANATRLSPSTGEASRTPFGLTRGTPLAPSLRAKFEPKFGTDFSRVRVHADANAAALARAYQADAFTIGSHVVLAKADTDRNQLKGNG